MLKIIGHRGARGMAPENTIDALQAGLEAGVHGLEFDVRVTKDNVPVLCHDPHIKTIVGNLPIADTTLAVLKKHHKDLPTLAEALKALRHRVPAMIEVKKAVPVEPVAAVLQSFLKKGWKPEHIMVGSKDYAVLKALRKQLPDLPLVIIEPWSGVRATRRARIFHTPYLSMNQLFLWWGFIRGARSSGHHLFAYTLNNPRKAAYWAKHGLYGVITDYPARYNDIED